MRLVLASSGVVGGADDLDDAVDVVDGDDQALDDLLARARLFELEQRAARDHVAAVIDEVQRARP